MLARLKAMSERYNRYMTYVGRKRACDALLLSSDRMLKDAGFSRELLQQGAEAWPWLAADADYAHSYAKTYGASTADNLFNLNAKSGVESYNTENSVEDAVTFNSTNKNEQDRRKVA